MASSVATSDGRAIGVGIRFFCIRLDDAWRDKCREGSLLALQFRRFLAINGNFGNLRDPRSSVFIRGKVLLFTNLRPLSLVVKWASWLKPQILKALSRL